MVIQLTILNYMYTNVSAYSWLPFYSQFGKNWMCHCLFTVLYYTISLSEIITNEISKENQ